MKTVNEADVVRLAKKLSAPFALDDYVSFLSDMIQNEGEIVILAQTGTLYSHLYVITLGGSIRHKFATPLHYLAPCKLESMCLLEAEEDRGPYHSAMTKVGLNPAKFLYTLTPLGKEVAQTLVLIREIER
jgi:hypothetical protein